MHIDDQLYDLATDRQKEYIDAIRQHGSANAASRALGLSRDIVARAIRTLTKRAARLGYAPGHFENGTAPGYLMGKVTVQRASDGSVERTWERQSPEQSGIIDALEIAVEAMMEKIEPVSPVDAPIALNDNLLTLYTFTDYHVGMLAWHREGGEDWDLGIAERTGSQAMRALVDGSPPSAHAIVNIQGDFLHWDGLTAITPMHGHVLDGDGRFGKVVDVAIRLIRHLVAQALHKHQEVTLLICEGNHDLASSLWLRKLFGALYENEPRVTVHNSELPYYAIRWGSVMLGFHHGHLRKNGDLPNLFAAQFREMWGQCRKVAIHTGHRHHREIKEHPGAEVIQHPTIAARDAYAARGGWWSERRITAIVYHREHGEVATATVTPEMLEA